MRMVSDMDVGNIVVIIRGPNGPLQGIYLFIMGTIFHFGDSYAGVGKVDKHFVKHIAKKINYTYNGIGHIPGGSNEMILSKLLSCVMDIKKGDILFFNFSFFTRGSYYDKDLKKIMSTNYYYNDMDDQITLRDDKDYIMDIISYQMDNNEDYNRRLFHQFNILFKHLHLKGISIYYIFIRENEWSNFLLQYGIKINFSTDFHTWLKDNEYHNEEEVHYTRGVQEHICDYVMGQMTKLI